jgi:hypothetical protein
LRWVERRSCYRGDLALSPGAQRSEQRFFVSVGRPPWVAVMRVIGATDRAFSPAWHL